jgi:hypothetical protein
MYWISTVPSEIRQLNLDLLFDQIIAEEQIFKHFLCFLSIHSYVLFKYEAELDKKVFNNDWRKIYLKLVEL